MNVTFRQFDCTIEKLQYHNGRIALRLMGTGEIYGEPVATATVNIADDDTQPDEVVIKDYSENEGMYQTLLNAGIITPAHRYTSSGWIESIPISRLAVPL
ncbi:MAG: hypothetical protein JWQ66_2924 [Mucilaginibacter sp.]|nr:hypothetical protein [Mucilaginibacter sp.]